MISFQGKIPDGGQEPEQMKVEIQEHIQEHKELEKRLEHTEKVLEDQVMQGASSPGTITVEKESFPQVSPMLVDGIDLSVVGEAVKTSEVMQYTQQQEADIQTIVHFFLSGGDDGESDESVIWAKLAKKVLVLMFS